ncbi:HIT-like protein [Collybia nuda]|uniref:HIT-like protein n=1 Tax=Collybia nuda TaxID=64659 RepID=A0A9P5Y6C1_9AGAR|nr:HIT-like protein [Collybia nuda]
MTSFIIKSHVDRLPAPSWNPYQDSETDCTFCRIVRNELPAFKVFEDDNILAILDILPLRKGHTLVIPKVHYSRLSELPPDYAAASGQAVSKVAHALTEALGNTALNVVCNQEYAQAVPHVHYHIIPAPTFDSLPECSTSQRISDSTIPPTRREMHQREFESREELNENEGELLAQRIRRSLVRL